MKIRFDNLEAGWVDVRVEDDEEVIVSDSFSYTPYDSFGDLIDALFVMSPSYRGNHEKTIIFSTEPLEYEVTFSKKSNDIELIISSCPDMKRNFSARKEIYRVAGKYEEICIPFWRALRNLQSKHSKEQLNELWRRPFPFSDLNKLTEKIKFEKTFFVAKK